MKAVPIVAIVGRTNAGKSSLLNRLSGKHAAITAREEGTTRDNVWQKVTTAGKTFWLIDTAGFKQAEDDFEQDLEQRVSEAVEIADLVLFVVDGSSVLDSLDLKAFKTLRKSGKDYITIANKADRFQDIDKSFAKLVGSDFLRTSATQGQGLAELMNKIVTHHGLSGVGVDSRRATTLAIIGRPNTGKSSLFNSITSRQQAIVSSQSGTTRDLNRCELNYHNHLYELVDSAGIKRASKVERGVEKFSYLKSLWAIENSDVCILAIDAQEAGVSLEQKLADMVEKAGKGLILAVTKWDLLDSDPDNGDDMLRRLQYDFRFVDWASIVFTSTTVGKNIGKVLELSHEIKSKRDLQFETSTINEILQSLVNSHLPAGLKSHQPRLKYATQTDVRPTTITIFGRDAEQIHPNYERYLRRGFREQLNISGTPVMLKFKDNE